MFNVSMERFMNVKVDHLAAKLKLHSVKFDRRICIQIIGIVRR